MILSVRLNLQPLPKSIPMKSPAIQFSACVAACVLSACSTVTVTTDYDHAAAFGKYKTYALEPAKQGQALSPTAEAALRDALRTELAVRGISEAPAAKADLVKHGEYIAQISLCAFCHSPFREDSTMIEEFKLAGGQKFAGLSLRHEFRELLK